MPFCNSACGLYYGMANVQLSICYSKGAVMARFVGRQQELARLLETTRKSSASFVVVRGRRRVGKSRLIEEFSHHFDHYYVFTGLAPDKDTTAEHQLKEFSRQMARQFNTARAVYEDWSDAFWAMAERVQSGKVLVFFDEIGRAHV